MQPRSRLAGLPASWSYLEARTIRKKLLRCRGPTSSRSRGARSVQAPQRRPPRRRLPGPQRLWLPRLLGPAPPRGAAGVASGARIARAGVPGCGSPLLSLALRDRARRLRSWRPRLKELLAIPSTQKVSPLLSTSHFRHHVTAAELGWGWRAGKAGTVFPRPHLLPSALFSRLRTSRGQGRHGEWVSVVFRGGEAGDWESLRRAQQVPR